MVAADDKIWIEHDHRGGIVHFRDFRKSTRQIGSDDDYRNLIYKTHPDKDQETTGWWVARDGVVFELAKIDFSGWTHSASPWIGLDRDLLRLFVLTGFVYGTVKKIMASWKRRGISWWFVNGCICRYIEVNTLTLGYLPLLTLDASSTRSISSPARPEALWSWCRWRCRWRWWWRTWPD